MSSMIDSGLKVPLRAAIHDSARQFAAEQSIPEKGLRVYLNTLAVWSVHRYLKWLQIDTDINQGDSWNPSLRALFDVADLVIPDLGKIECRPFLPGEEVIALPIEARQNRLGYIGVGFSNNLDEVELLGFSSLVEPEELSRKKLQSLDSFLEYLDKLATQPINLQQWLQEIFTEGWETLEELLTPRTPSLAFRFSSVRRAKLIELATPVILVITLIPEANKNLVINLQVYPQGEQGELPSNLKLIVLTETGEIFREVITNSGDTLLRYEFSGSPREKFGIRLELGETSYSQNFAIP